MKPLQRLFGLSFPDPCAGQVWRSRHSGKSIRVKSVCVSDCGSLWQISLEHDDGEGGFIGIAMEYYMSPEQWYRKLRDEARELIEPNTPINLYEQNREQLQQDWCMVGVLFLACYAVWLFYLLLFSLNK